MGIIIKNNTNLILLFMLDIANVKAYLNYLTLLS